VGISLKAGGITSPLAGEKIEGEMETMKFCNECVGEVGACCDFCKHYDFNGEDGIYTGNGHCRKHNRREDPGGACDDFHCEKAKDSELT